MIYSVDFDRWVAMMLPTMLRRRRVMAFCRAMCAPVRRMYGELLDERRRCDFRLRYSGQVCRLRAALNEAFGLSRGFEVMDGDSVGGTWVFARDEAIEGQLYTMDEGAAGDGVVVWDEGLLRLPLNGFAVDVPTEIYDGRLDEVRSVVEMFRLPSKTAVYVRGGDARVLKL